MVWDQLSINKPHLVYIILGGFTSIFMLVSLFIKEKLYIGEATVATICGLIFGPHAANLIDPGSWGNTDQITLEFSRIVLVVQCFAVGVELPKAYMERHWRSVVFLLVPVMTFGWLITSLFIWWMVEPLTWLESLCVAACVTATDPVLASSVVGKGKFAKRVPKHIRDILSAESGCNDGMAFPFIYLAIYLIRYHQDASHVVFHWTCYTILYECVWGAVYGVLIGYIGRHMIKLAERKGLIDRESFLVFYFVLALFCAGSGSLLGMDDLLVGFAAGVGFSNDGWFTAKTEESHVSNVIDLLINLSYFVYFGTIIPWDQYNAPDHGIYPWKLVIIAIFVIFFRRIPIMLALKPLIPDIKTWREALFCGHFGPIGVGAIFVAILARAELEHDSTTPLSVLPPPDSVNYTLIYTIWPVTTFLVIASIVVHGSSVAVFTLGKRINTLTITLSYTQGNDQSSNWMNRLPRIASQSKSMPRTNSYSSMESADEKLDIPPGQLPPIGIPKLHLRRQKEDDGTKPPSRSSSRNRRRNKRKQYEDGMGPGGPISQSAIAPTRRSDSNLAQQESGSDTLNEKSERPSPERDEMGSDQLRQLKSGESSSHDRDRAREQREADVEVGKRPPSQRSSGDSPAEVEAYDEGNQLIIEDEEGNVIEDVDVKGRSDAEKAQIVEDARYRLQKDKSGEFAKHKHQPHEKDEGEEIEKDVEEAVTQPGSKLRKTFENWRGFGKGNKDGEAGGDDGQPKERRRGPAHAYQFGNTIIVEDEDGEVIKTYTLPRGEGEGSSKYNKQMREGMQKVGSKLGLGRKISQAIVPTLESNDAEDEVVEGDQDDDQADKLPENPEMPKLPNKRLERAKQREEAGESESDDDGLRMVISNSQSYGLTGLQKTREGERPSMTTMGGGRRLSTKDFIRQMQQMDPKSKIATAEDSNIPDSLKREIKRDAMREQESIDARPINKRASTSSNQISRSGEESRTGRTRATSDPKGSSRPQPVRSTTAESMETIGEDIPTADIRSTIARHGRGMTAAEQRRQRHSQQAIPEHPDNDDDNQETAAEKRRRLAALGVSGANDSDTSDSSEEDEPRQPKRAVQEPSKPMDTSPPTASMMTPTKAQNPHSSSPQQPRPRIQWGGEMGRDRSRPSQAIPQTEVPETTSHVTAHVDQGYYDDADPGVRMGRYLRGLLKKKS